MAKLRVPPVRECPSAIDTFERVLDKGVIVERESTAVAGESPADVDEDLAESRRGIAETPQALPRHPQRSGR
jgi:hypothetical protein